MKKFTKIFGWVIAGVLVLIIAGLAYIHLVPGYTFSVVKSGSMTGTFNVGDVIVTGPSPKTLEPGMIVMYQHGQETITHRLLSVNGNTVTTKGDALQHEDPWQTPISDVKGIYLFRIPLIGYLLTFVKTKLGWFISIIVPAMVLIGWLCWDVIKEAFKNEPETVRASAAKQEAKPAVAAKAAAKVVDTVVKTENPSKSKSSSDSRTHESFDFKKGDFASSDAGSNARLKAYLAEALKEGQK